jgi:DNA polymerase (family X)
VASIHGRLKMDRKAQTERLIRAVSNKHTTILGHMTGRQLLRRPGYAIDFEKVLRACAKHSVAVEINAHPCFSTWTGAGTKPRSISDA